MTDVRFDFMAIPYEDEKESDEWRSAACAMNPGKPDVACTSGAFEMSRDATHERSIQSHFFVAIALGQ
ncbi:MULTISPECIES: hypothetical protein [Paraburkholderia]|jgi:hypothetical protein|uniref:Uncharacterized protein n=1 Tax=Paraburkholderia largidicola TaxID=3014751 RepID=A0A7I8BRK0_9BURK|nr:MULTISPECIES: hypothetical protein [Paraburkholderia]BCF91387.1 hypothetical protein PPGU16_44540 [Paraburkholderia sp. PGU16]GJH02211.1 hypothetical protein CBA19C8_16660 [Paraburkholderia terrae]GJH37690.1 hypothetical protein CBA19CS91_33055 [Paraburkholderia hospita]